MADPVLHYPTALDWIEHGLAFYACWYLGWRSRSWYLLRLVRRRERDGRPL